jgi:hypothetical protein
VGNNPEDLFEVLRGSRRTRRWRSVRSFVRFPLHGCAKVRENPILPRSVGSVTQRV